MFGCFVAQAQEKLAPNTQGNTNRPTAVEVELQLLQGRWDGVLVGDEARQTISLTISSNSLYFHRDADFWFETSFRVPAGKDPKQVEATIKRCPPSQAESIGKVVRAFFKIENDTLTLATIGEGADETEESFEAAGTRYEFRRVGSKTEPPKAK